MRRMRGGGGATDLLLGAACRVYDEAEAKFVSPFAYRRADGLASMREDAERRRLFYVAATRAQDYLIVSGQVTMQSRHPDQGDWLARLAAGCLRTDGDRGRRGADDPV